MPRNEEERDEEYERDGDEPEDDPEVDEPEGNEEEGGGDGDEPEELTVPFLNPETNEYEEMPYEEVERIIRESKKPQRQQQANTDLSQHVALLREVSQNQVAQFAVEYRRVYPYAKDTDIIRAWEAVNQQKAPQFETEEERREYERDQKIAELARRQEEDRRNQRLREIHENNNDKLVAALNEYGWDGNLTDEQSQRIIETTSELYPELLRNGRLMIEEYPLNTRQAKTIIREALGSNARSKKKVTASDSSKPRVPSREDLERLKKAPRAVPGDTSRGERTESRSGRPKTKEERLDLLWSL